MKKNVASQVIGCQLVSKTDGSAVTSGTTTVYVTGDGGLQAVGSVGSGACTHEGNGFWTYAPAQAETNYDHVAFTFVNTSACNVTVQVFPSFPQTGDNFARIGAPVGASISADIAAVQSDTDNIQTRIPAALVSGRIDASVGAMEAGVVTAVAIATDAIDNDAIAADVTAVIADAVWNAATASYGTAGTYGVLVETNLDGTVSSRASQASVDTVATYVDTEVAAIKAKTDNLPAAFPTNFADLAITASTGRVTVGTNADKTGYALASTDVNVATIGGDATATTNLKRAALGTVTATVGAGSTTTSIVTSAMSPAATATGQFIGRIVIFDSATTTAALRGQATEITGSTAAGVLTVTALTTAPVSGDTFTVT